MNLEPNVEPDVDLEDKNLVIWKYTLKPETSDSYARICNKTREVGKSYAPASNDVTNFNCFSTAFNRSQTKFAAIILVLLVFFNAIFVLPTFRRQFLTSDNSTFFSSKTG